MPNERYMLGATFDQVLKKLTMTYFQDGQNSKIQAVVTADQTKLNMARWYTTYCRASKLMMFEPKLTSVGQFFAKLCPFKGLDFENESKRQKSKDGSRDCIFGPKKLKLDFWGFLMYKNQQKKISADLTTYCHNP